MKKNKTIQPNPFERARFNAEKTVLYEKPKSLPRKVLQEIFLKSLSVIFPKNYQNYKLKIKNFLNTKITSLKFKVFCLYLKIRYPYYFKLPFRHIYTIHTLINFLRILERKKIKFFLNGGSLLGAVRQEACAGRPTDIDLGIKEEQSDKLLECLPLLIKSGAISVRHWKDLENPHIQSKKLERVQILYRFTMVDIAVYKKKSLSKKKLWFTKCERSYDKKIFSFPLEPLKPIKLYGKEFLAPNNPEIYLKKKYGKNWKIPDKKQFFWNNKLNIKQNHI